MRSLKLTVAYDGTDFCGWQAQTSGRSVQLTLESAISAVTGEQVRVTASGRTDAGVHAIGQVVSFETRSQLELQTLQRAFNAHLPADLRVRSVEAAKPGFHAVRAARRKHYRYVIETGDVADPFCRRYCWFLSRSLQISAMRAAARHLTGRHDFASFQAAGSPRKSTVRTVHELTLHSQCSELATIIRLDIKADGFLYNMARNIIGTLVEVGLGKYDSDWPLQVLQSRDRRKAGPTAPPQGLFLVSVDY